MAINRRFLRLSLVWLVVMILLIPGTLGEAQAPGYAEILVELKAKLKAFQERTKDPWILKCEYE